MGRNGERANGRQGEGGALDGDERAGPMRLARRSMARLFEGAALPIQRSSFARSPIRPFARSPCRPVALSPCRPVARSPCRPFAHTPFRRLAHSLLIASRASVSRMLRALLLLISISGIAMGGSWKYPVAKTGDVVDDYAGTKVADPYRWLENTDSPETIAWIKAENDISLPYLEKLPDRPDFHDRMTKLLNYERYSTPYWVGGRYIYQKNDGLQNQSVIYTVKNLDDAPQLVLDPNQLAKDGTVSVGIESLSNDGRVFAYGLESHGSDWTEIHG